MNSKMQSKLWRSRLLLAGFFLFFFHTVNAYGEASGAPISFARSYAGLEVTRNFPTATTEEILSPGKAHAVLSYRFVLDDAWIMGVFGGFRMLRTRELNVGAGGELPILSLVHESAKILRLYHPTYLAVGFRLLYLMPATYAMVPTGRSKEFPTEFGASMTATLIHLMDPKRMLTLRVERWRGTGSTKYNGIEVAAGGAISFD